MIADADGSGKPSAAGKCAMFQYIKVAKVLTVRELCCAMKVDTNKDGKTDATEMLVFERCLGIGKVKGAPGYKPTTPATTARSAQRRRRAARSSRVDGDCEAIEKEQAFGGRFDAEKNASWAPRSAGGQTLQPNMTGVALMEIKAS